MKWISIDKQFPKDLESVLLFYPYGSEKGMIFVGHWDAFDDEWVCDWKILVELFFYDDRENFVSIEDKFALPFPEVTHWMPLPKTPQ